MHNISSLTECFGCGVCAISCPKKLINIELTEDGFYAPTIPSDKLCNGCGICTSICAHINQSKHITTSVISSYAAYNKDSKIRKTAASGGIAHAITDYLIKQGHKACVVRYNSEKKLAEHYIAHNTSDLEASLGSKYMQSYTVTGLQKILGKDKYVIIGTPCMIASARNLIELKRLPNKYVLIDFFCHGVPSALLWNKYLRIQEQTIGQVKKVLWRDKTYGWHNSYHMTVHGSKGIYSKGLTHGDLFYKLFLGDYCLNKACYSTCKFKQTASAADIRIGDLWSTKYKTNDEGYSALITYTKKGEDVIKQATNLMLREEPIRIVTEGQLSVPPHRPYVSRLIMRILKKGYNSWWRELIIITIDSTYRKIIKAITSPRVVLKNRLRWFKTK